MTKKTIRIVFLCLFLTIGNNAKGQVYHLMKVTSIEAGKLYVFGQKDSNGTEYVMTDKTNSSGGLLTTTTFDTENLTGTEEYVWKW